MKNGIKSSGYGMVFSASFLFNAATRSSRDTSFGSRSSCLRPEPRLVPLISCSKTGSKLPNDQERPLVLPSPVEPYYGPSKYLPFEGFSVDEKGVQRYMDTTIAYRLATLRCIEYLRRYGRTSHSNPNLM